MVQVDIEKKAAAAKAAEAEETAALLQETKTRLRQVMPPAPAFHFALFPVSLSFTGVPINSGGSGV